MQPEELTAEAAGPDASVDLLEAIAYGDASPEDLVAELRAREVDALDLLVQLTRRAAAPRRDAAPTPIDVGMFTREAASGERRHAPHRVPKVPFVAGGTLYDPQDVARFDDRDLHFVAMGPDEPMLVLDRPVIGRWWELSYLTALVDRKEYLYHGYIQPPAGWMHSGNAAQPINPNPPHTVGGPVKPEGARFYDDMHGGGDFVFVPPNRGCADLRKVGRGFLGLGDWNDVISSFDQYYASLTKHTCVLYEDINWAGDTLTSHEAGAFAGYLEHLGWNDRASGVAAW
jgi:hypothetical protein